MSRRVLELGNYIIPAYAGMVLAEQGYSVEKWTNGRDPTLALARGAELWAWLNEGKTLLERHFSEVAAALDGVEIVIENVRPSTLARYGVDPVQLAERFGVVWIGMRSETDDETSFDILAQARAWGEFAPYVPFYIGDTTGGLWMSFKAAATTTPGFYPLYHASCLAKMVEGELIVDVERDGQRVPWDEELYEFADGKARVEYKGRYIEEAPKDRAWKLRHLRHNNGRIVI